MNSPRADNFTNRSPEMGHPMWPLSLLPWGRGVLPGPASEPGEAAWRWRGRSCRTPQLGLNAWHRSAPTGVGFCSQPPAPLLVVSGCHLPVSGAFETCGNPWPRKLSKEPNSKDRGFLCLFDLAWASRAGFCKFTVKLLSPKQAAKQPGRAGRRLN